MIPEHNGFTLKIAGYIILVISSLINLKRFLFATAVEEEGWCWAKKMVKQTSNMA